MLVHLKNQKLLPTVLFAIFYFSFDSLFFVLTYLLGTVIWILVLGAFAGMLDMLKFSPAVWTTGSQVVITVIATVNEIFQTKKLHHEHFKKYPLTPLFFIAIAVLSTMYIAWWYVLGPIAATVWF